MRKLALALVLVALPLHASTEGERLTALCRVWSAATFLDPDVVFGTIDWDGALVRAIPKARAASSDEELARAIGSMLAELQDTASKIVGPSRDITPAGVSLSSHDGDVVVLNVGPYAATHTSLFAELRPLGAEVRKARGVVVDIRYHGDADGAESMAYGLSTLGAFSAKDVSAPANEYVFHSGFAPESGGTSGGYYSALLTVPGTNYTGTGGAAPAKVAFVTDGRSPLPDIAIALHAAGKGALFSSDPLDAGVLAATKDIALPGGWRAAVRVSRPRGNIAADVVTADPMAAALAFAHGEALPPHAIGGAVPLAGAEPRVRKPADFGEMTYPDVEHRIYAAMRLWSVIDTFYPYKALIGDWSAVLPELLPRFIDAKDADQYAAAVMEMTARVEDGHSSAFGHPSALKIFGAAYVPATVRVVENQYVVVRLLGDASDLHPGDVVVSVDGEPIQARIDRLRRYVTASTERARVNRLANTALRGAAGSTAVLEVKGADGAVRTVRVARSTAQPKPADTPVYKVLDGNIGYVDMTRLMPAQVDAMFDALMKTKAIIFDMRGYPNGTAWPIVPRINTKNAKVGALFRRAQISGASGGEEAASGFFFEQALPKSDKPKYTGKTVMLIDDRAISQSEHTGLFFEAASGTTFIGSPTAGANGDVTNFRLPGGFGIGFTGHDVRHADGRQLQRVGLQPDVAVEPTIRGIREGRDEVLDRAVGWINALGH